MGLARRVFLRPSNAARPWPPFSDTRTHTHTLSHSPTKHVTALVATGRDARESRYARHTRFNAALAPTASRSAARC